MSSLLLFIFTHILLIGILVSAVILLLSVIVGAPHCKRVVLLTEATTMTGIENLAKYLCKKAGNVSADDVWKTFIPAAQRLAMEHQRRRLEFQARRTTLA